MGFINGFGESVSASSGNTTNINVTQSPALDRVVALNERRKIHGYISGSEWRYTYDTSGYTFTVIPIIGGVSTIRGKARGTGGNIGTRLAILSEFQEPITDTSPVNYATGFSDIINISDVRIAENKPVPEDAKYLMIQLERDGTDCSPESLIIGNVDYSKNLRDEVHDYKWTGINWYCLGDSISYGYYSMFKEDGTADSNPGGLGDNQWTNIVANANGWNLSNYSLGGKGWMETNISGNMNRVAYDQVRRIGDDWKDCDIVTFAYGINDYKSDHKDWAGALTDSYTYSDDYVPTTAVQSMRFCFDYILKRNPACKIIVITPMNIRGYHYNYGDASTRWARGHKVNSPYTLDEFADLMIAVCDEYGIEYIDMTRYSGIDNSNIVEALPDGVHPSAECHKMIGHQLAKKINFA